ncbi:glycosyltransferase [Ottowia sp.]|uniref:glycosyltransferase n=1 Tax=Ottowia sp. TaxID=1898956 RepID=UPI002627C74F|nr:glycosyltransferase [Ottowia sp.]
MAPDSQSSRLHVYARDIEAGAHNSLSELVEHIPAGARVLDLGCGSGAIGAFLHRRDGAVAAIDGLTISEDEAALAVPHYRRVEVANLETCVLPELFSSGAYDIIVCADVLEHVRNADAVISACAGLLAPGGRLLLSIPNAGYAGLVAELMAGEFRYRQEGLLDETHVRFFTRSTLMRFLQSNDWIAERVTVIKRQLPDSEFRAAFDALPPAVARHLLVLPDALTYQFIVVARPRRADEPRMEAPPADAPLPAQALFTSQLYLGAGDGFDETHKLTVGGVIGLARQTLRFALPSGTPPSGLKLDPADRPGYLHLHGLVLHAADGNVLWRWSPADTATLVGARMSGIVAQPPALPSDAFVLLLHGADPWIELPVPAAALAQAGGGSLDVRLGWPMSADYLALAASAERYATALAERSAEADTERQARQRLEQQAQHLRAQKQALLQQTHALSRERDEAAQLVHDIENSTVFRATRPIVHAKMRVDRLLGTGSARKPSTEAAPARPLTPGDEPVDIIVPVYRGLDDTRRCIESVLASSCRTPWRLVVIDDASPEPEVSAWLQEIAATDSRIELLRNEQNLGFVGTVNRGMALTAERDVLLLNSDTEVANDWLDRIRAAAYGDQKVASVTPFSNNATICSYPRFCEDNPLPSGWDTARLDALFARTNTGQVVDVPTGVGFCMYLRRAALREVGLFDVEHFGKGYGEENDFCIRAAKAGWRNLHVLDTFVRHFGGVSFGASKSPRERAAMQTLRRLHPRYEAEVLRFVHRDPARPARTAVDLARLLDGRHPLVLAVLHDRNGGTERHVVELAELLRERARFLLLRPLPGQRLSLRLPGPEEGFELVFNLPEQGGALIDLLRRLGVCHVHVHHLLGHGEFVRRLPARLGVSYDFTAHDFYFADPGITLTDANGSYDPARDPAATAATAAPDAQEGSLVRWRQRSAEFLNGARFVIAPSRDMLARLVAVVPGAPLHLVPHTDVDPTVPLPRPAPAPLAGDRPLRVAVIGALSAIKGADVLEDAALAARKHGAPVEFHLIGYAYRTLRAQPHANLAVYGRYDEKDLPDLLRWLQPDLVWFPAQWPETYSYTLSACLQGGWPVVAPDLGAFAERLADRGWSWIRPWHQSAQQWVDFFTDLRQRHFVTAQGPVPLPPRAADAGLASTREFAPEPPAWYAGPYLADLPAPDAAELPAEAWLPYLPEPDGGLAAGARGRALTALARLRALPVLAPLARAIPLRWQTRVKSWLRK